MVPEKKKPETFQLTVLETFYDKNTDFKCILQL